MVRGRRNKAKYPHASSEYDNVQIKLAVTEAGNIKQGAKKLGVNKYALAAAIRQRGISIGVKGRGGRPSRYDWVAIEKAWRSRPEGTFTSRFAREHGIQRHNFYATAVKRGFYASPPRGGKSLASIRRRAWKPVGLRIPRGIRIENLTRENKDKALTALNNILHLQMMSEFVCQERRELKGAIGAAFSRNSARPGAA